MNRTARYTAVTIFSCSVLAGQAFAKGGKMAGGGHGSGQHMGSQNQQGGMMAGTNQSSTARSTAEMPMHQGSDQRNQMHTTGQQQMMGTDPQKQMMGTGTAAGSKSESAPQAAETTSPAGY